MGIKIRFEPQKAKVPFNVFTGFSRVITKKKSYVVGIRPAEIHDGRWIEQEFSRNYISNFWDLGIGLKADISDKLFFSAETLAGYSLDPSPGKPQGIGRYEFNLGVGVRF